MQTPLGGTRRSALEEGTVDMRCKSRFVCAHSIADSPNQTQTHNLVAYSAFDNKLASCDCFHVTRKNDLVFGEAGQVIGRGCGVLHEVFGVLDERRPLPLHEPPVAIVLVQHVCDLWVGLHGGHMLWGVFQGYGYHNGQGYATQRSV